MPCALTDRGTVEHFYTPLAAPAVAVEEGRSLEGRHESNLPPARERAKRGTLNDGTCGGAGIDCYGGGREQRGWRSWKRQRQCFGSAKAGGGGAVACGTHRQRLLPLAAARAAHAMPSFAHQPKPPDAQHWLCQALQAVLALWQLAAHDASGCCRRAPHDIQPKPQCSRQDGAMFHRCAAVCRLSWVVAAETLASPPGGEHPTAPANMCRPRRRCALLLQ